MTKRGRRNGGGDPGAGGEASEAIGAGAVGDAERRRLAEDAARTQNWKRWGPYLGERQWGTVREDYSPDGTCWDYFPHDHARSRAYRWGEDGLLGITDRQCRLCLSLALWNGRDAILKERLFGLTGPEGNHGEDVKEEYFYLDATPTSSWLRGLYKYPQAAFPYEQLLAENRRRGRHDPEYELADTGVFDGGRYFDVFATYAKAAPDDVLLVVDVHNRGPEDAVLHVLPQLWFRNTWSWGRTGEGYWPRGRIERVSDARLLASGANLPPYWFELDADDARTATGAGAAELRGPIFTENDTNVARLFGAANGSPFVKDGFHAHVVDGAPGVVREDHGSKAAFHCVLTVPAGGARRLRLRLRPAGTAAAAFGAGFDAVLRARRAEADAFHEALECPAMTPDERRVHRQAHAGLLWSKQYYHYDVAAWLDGDPAQPTPPAARHHGRNAEWTHLYNRDVVSMPDKWEYPWYAAWDLAFHMVPFARLDPQFAKDQLLLFLREWYMAPSGALPAYEFAFGDANPPVHAWAVWRTYKIAAARGRRDREFLERAFHKLLLNFTWWVNRKDLAGRHVFGGGFLGLDNVGVFDRNHPLPDGGQLEQADGTAWMAFYCSTMLSIALELARTDATYEDVASKFFEHFVAITDAINTLGGTGLWDEQDGFYHDQIRYDGHLERLRLRSMVGLIPLFAVEVLDGAHLRELPGFWRRMRWFLQNRSELARHVVEGADGRVLLAVPPRDRLERVLRYLLDEREFLSPFGVRSLSAAYRERPFVWRAGGGEEPVRYTPGESTTALFGGNSNWRGPVWLPMNFLLLEALERYGHFYGDSLLVECPTGSGRRCTLQGVADELAARLSRLFLPDAAGRRPFAGDDARFAADPHWRDLVLFHEYFHGDDGRGLGASHQTGWTALIAPCLESLARRRDDCAP